jgi:hypothetical protein
VIGLAWGALAALGVHLLWSRPAPRQTDGRVRLRERGRRLAVPLGAALLGTVLATIAVGGPAALVAGGVAAGCAVVGRRSIDAARRDQARRLWPNLLEELRVLTTSGGRSLPRALLEAGRRVPEPAGEAFRATQQAWRVSADFERSLAVLADHLRRRRRTPCAKPCSSPTSWAGPTSGAAWPDSQRIDDAISPPATWPWPSWRAPASPVGSSSWSPSAWRWRARP